MYVAAQHRVGRAKGTGSDFGFPPHLVASMRSVALVVALVACVHAGFWALLRDQAHAPEIQGQLASVSYDPFTAPPKIRNAPPSAAQIRADLKALAPYTRAVRIYQSTGGAELIPAIAEELGLKVTVGVWLNTNKDNNERELRAAIDLARKHRNVNGIVVGNETFYRNERVALAKAPSG